MTTKVRQLKKQIEKLTEIERPELLDNLHDSVEDYLLAKVAHQRSLKDTEKCHSWESIKRHR